MGKKACSNVMGGSAIIRWQPSSPTRPPVIHINVSIRSTLLQQIVIIMSL